MLKRIQMMPSELNPTIGRGLPNLTPSKSSLDHGDPCPHCGGLLFLRDVVSSSGTYREVWCGLCSRVQRCEELEMYRPMPEVSLNKKDGVGWGERELAPWDEG